MCKKQFFTLLISVLLGVLLFTGCPESEETSDYTLTITMGSGATGTPAAGSYTYSENEIVNYNYSAQAGYGNLIVTLDGAPVGNSGVVTMTANHTLDVTATIDVRGTTWTGLAYNPNEPPPNNFYFECTFSGGVLSGTAHAHIETLGNLNGEYTVDGNEITATLRYGANTLTCTGTFSNANYMNGDWDWDEYGNPQTGTWYLER